MLISIQKSIARHFEVIAEVAGLAIALSGATLAAVFGKFVIAVILGAIALGLFLRFTGRRSQGQAVARVTPGWVRLASAGLAAIEAAALVEATDLPVRFSQQGFEFKHWVLVGLVFSAAYLVQVKILRALANSELDGHRS
ncbi:MAG: hypothetical protein V4792_00240 [Pseudomonadota bacterium]